MIKIKYERVAVIAALLVAGWFNGHGDRLSEITS